MLSFNPSLFVSIFALIFVAELPDKTAFATLVMATRNHPAAIFVGVALAFLVQTIVAVCFGKAFGLLPEHWVRMAAGFLFLVFAVMAWLRKQEDEVADGAGSANTKTFAKTVLRSFVVIFIAEWGDLTQLATATLVAKYPAEIPTVFLSALLALWSTTAVAVLIGNRAKSWINPMLIQRISAVAFAGVGIVILYRG
jgi:putative Ca2+/H+ antiporter (TMEM165/GDT1 family)